MNFEEYYKEKYKEIENALSKIIERESDENIKKLISFVLGGKHFRGTLTLLTTDVLCGDKEKALRYACIVEMLHSGSLCHDDIIDLDLLRRSKPALWVIADELVKSKDIKKVISEFFDLVEGKVISIVKLLLKRHAIPIAILTGDTLLMKAMEISEEEVRDETIKVIHQMLSGVCDELRKNESEYYYFRCIKGKTASLFRFSTWLGWLASGKPNYPVVELGEKLGVLYQIVDDMCDEELPSFIDPEIEIKKVYNEVVNLIDKLPENEYKEIFKEVPLYMIRKLAYESDMENEILKIIGGGTN